MLKEKNTLFTIGQFAALHEINKKTLMWYDEIGLLKPACIKENGYRYYSYQQSTVLETILMLRELNVSLDEIKQFMENEGHRSHDPRSDQRFYKGILLFLDIAGIFVDRLCIQNTHGKGEYNIPCNNRINVPLEDNQHQQQGHDIDSQ